MNEPRSRSMNSSSMLVWSSGEALGVLHGQPLLLAQPGLVGSADGAVELLVQPLRPDRVRPETEADGALVELGDPHARRFAHADREDALVVGRVHQPRGRRAELGLQRPDLHGIATLAGRDVETGHAATLCQYSWLRVQWIRVD